MPAITPIYWSSAIDFSPIHICILTRSHQKKGTSGLHLTHKSEPSYSQEIHLEYRTQLCTFLKSPGPAPTAAAAPAPSKSCALSLQLQAPLYYPASASTETSNTPTLNLSSKPKKTIGQKVRKLGKKAKNAIKWIMVDLVVLPQVDEFELEPVCQESDGAHAGALL